MQNVNNTNVLSNKPKVLRSMCDILGEGCKDLTVDLLSGSIDDTIFMSKLIDSYGQERVNNAVFSSVALERNSGYQNKTTSNIPYSNYENDTLKEASRTNENMPGDDIIPANEEDVGECPVCLSPAMFGIGKSVCQVLSNARRNGEIENDELTCNDIVDDFGQGKISNRDMVALLIEAYGEDAVVSALNKVNRVLEDGIMIAREDKEKNKTVVV